MEQVTHRKVVLEELQGNQIIIKDTHKKKFYPYFIKPKGLKPVYQHKGINKIRKLKACSWR